MQPHPEHLRDWTSVREQFPVTERVVYLNTGWSGPSARRVVDAVQRRLQREAYEGPTTLPIRNEKARLVQRARSVLARVVHADADEIALVGTTTEGVNAILHGIGLQHSDEILTSSLEHSSVLVPTYDMVRRSGVLARVVRIGSNETADDVLHRFTEAISSRTKLVVLSHISYNRGTRLPIRRIVDAAHSTGALVLIDGAQSVGHIEVDVRALDVDFYAFPAHKYVLGPDGVGALYIRRDLIERVAPVAVAHGASEFYDFDGTFHPQEGSMRKFEMTTHSGPLLAGTIEAVALLEEIGIPAIEERTLGLATRLLEGLSETHGVRLTTPLDPELRSGLVTFAVQDQEPHETCAALWHLARIVGRVTNERRVRISLAMFNDEAEVATTLAAIEQLAAHGLPRGSLSAQQYKAQLLEDDD